MSNYTPDDRERWMSQVGLVLAIAGNAIGLGNFLRFPVQATQNGGGTFMIPYFIALVLVGIPLIWVELAMGRFGGVRGYGTTPGMFFAMTKNHILKYFGALGIVIPIGIVIYYTYVESWTLGFSIFSLFGNYVGVDSFEKMKAFLSGYQGIVQNEYFSGIGVAYVLFLVTLLINIWVLSKGVAGGIEKLAKIGMPLLFIMAIILLVRVITLEGASQGLAFIWNPDFSQLSNSAIWLAAAGQIFFTLSVGTGSIQTYASYLREEDDIALTGLATASTNEFCEVILGGTIAIPASMAFFGYAKTLEVAQGGSFNLGFSALPIIFQNIPMGMIFGAIWFGLLFVAGITSSVALAQPALCFLQENLKYTRKKASIALGIFLFICAQPVIFLLKYGFLDELDFWSGTFGLFFFALLEVLLFGWLFKMDNGWQEIIKGAQVRIPLFFRYVIQYITPFFLLVIFISWLKQNALSAIMMDGVDPTTITVKWGARLLLVGIFLFLIVVIKRTFKESQLPPSSR